MREAADVLLGRIEINDETREAIREAGRRAPTSRPVEILKYGHGPSLGALNGVEPLPQVVIRKAHLSRRRFYVSRWWVRWPLVKCDRAFSLEPDGHAHTG